MFFSGVIPLTTPRTIPTRPAKRKDLFFLLLVKYRQSERQKNLRYHTETLYKSTVVQLPQQTTLTKCVLTFIHIGCLDGYAFCSIYQDICPVNVEIQKRCPKTCHLCGKSIYHTKDRFHFSRTYRRPVMNPN